MAVPTRWPSQRRCGHDTHNRGAGPDLTRPGSAPVRVQRPDAHDDRSARGDDLGPAKNIAEDYHPAFAGLSSSRKCPVFYTMAWRAWKCPRTTCGHSLDCASATRRGLLVEQDIVVRSEYQGIPAAAIPPREGAHSKNAAAVIIVANRFTERLRLGRVEAGICCARVEQKPGRGVADHNGRRTTPLAVSGEHPTLPSSLPAGSGRSWVCPPRPRCHHDRHVRQSRRVHAATPIRRMRGSRRAASQGADKCRRGSPPA